MVLMNIVSNIEKKKNYRYKSFIKSASDKCAAEKLSYTVNFAELEKWMKIPC